MQGILVAARRAGNDSKPVVLRSGKIEFLQKDENQTVGGPTRVADSENFFRFVNKIVDTEHLGV